MNKDLAEKIADLIYSIELGRNRTFDSREDLRKFVEIDKRVYGENCRRGFEFARRQALVATLTAFLDEAAAPITTNREE